MCHKQRTVGSVPDAGDGGPWLTRPGGKTMAPKLCCMLETSRSFNKCYCPAPVPRQPDPSGLGRWLGAGFIHVVLNAAEVENHWPKDLVKIQMPGAHLDYSAAALLCCAQNLYFDLHSWGLNGNRVLENWVRGGQVRAF